LARTSGTEPSNGGVTITFTATVAGSTPTGTVSFFDGLTLIGTGALDGSFQASLTTTTLGSGTHAITAQYGGNAGNAPSASAPLTQTVVETRVATATTLTSGTNPSNKWRPVTFTATVSGGASTGSVIFSDGATALGTVALNGSGQASITTTSLPVGWRPVSARYLGNATHAPSATATPLFQTVNPAPGNGKLKVFILAGQSNMQGKALVETGRDPNNLTVTGVAGGLGSLRNMLNRNPAKYGFLANPASPIPGGNPGWITRSDVGVTYWSGGGASDVPSPSAPARNGNLDPYFGNNGEGPTSGNGRIGPEYAFGLEVGSQLGDKVLLIKYAFGGKSLAVEFRPPGAVAARGGVVGPYYTGMVAKVNQVLANLSTFYPGYTGGGYEIAGFGWHQGWNDRSNGAYTAEYEANMVNLIQDLRTQFSVPNLPVVIGNTGMANAPTGPGSLIEAQNNVGNPALHPELSGNVTTVNTIPFDYGVLLGEVDEGYHWNWNAESYYNIGESMAKAMMALLPADSSTPYSAWAADPAQGLTAGINDDPTDDPDFDGIENQLEFVLGSAPTVSSTTALPALTKSTGSWVFSYNRSVASRPPGSSQIVEYGNNLTGWTQITIPVTTSGSVTITPLGQMDHVEVTLPALGTTGFARLKVTQ
jgi:alpha-galactosidase